MIGADPASYYRYEVGHILHITPDQIGELTPRDLVGAMRLYRGDG